MQIHEITKQKINEQGFLSGLATGVTSALGKVGVAGPDASAYADSPTGDIRGQDAAFKATAGLVNNLVPSLAKAWGQTVANVMSQSKDPVTGAPVTSVDKLANVDKQQLRKELYAMINQTISPKVTGFNYETMDNDSTDVDVVDQADVIKSSISKDAEDIWSQTVSNAKSSAMMPLWKSLVQNGIGPAISFVNYKTPNKTKTQWRDNSSTRKLELLLPGRTAWEEFDIRNPEHVKAGREKGIIPV